MSKKEICEAKLNAVVANQKAEKVVKQLLKLSPDGFVDTPAELGVRLVKVVLRCKAFGHPARIPFYAFVKDMASLSILVDIQSGAVEVFDASTVSACANVTGDFVINGVTYGLKDTVNGQKRYHALPGREKPRERYGLQTPAVQEAMQELGIN